MCFYAYKRFVCENCGQELRCTTLKKRNCHKRSCNKVVPSGSPIRVEEKKEYDAACSCHFELVTPSEENKMYTNQ